MKDQTPEQHPPKPERDVPQPKAPEFVERLTFDERVELKPNPIFADIAETERELAGGGFPDGTEIHEFPRPDPTTLVAGRATFPVSRNASCPTGNFPYLSLERADGDGVVPVSPGSDTADIARGLGYDRVAWWDRIKTGGIPATGPIERSFECEFNAPLTTIVGGALPAAPEAFIREATLVHWDHTPGHEYDPNHSAWLGFTVTTTARGANDPTPFLRTAEILPATGSDDTAIEATVLINEDPPGVQRQLDRPRPDLVLDFDRKQRAVGFEFGYLDSPALPGHAAHYRAVTLTAFREDGTRIHQPVTPQLPLGDQSLDRNRVSYRIGVRSRDGDIARVALSFGRFNGDPEDEDDNYLVVPQVIFRVWSEPPVPAVTLQESTALFQIPQGQARGINTPDLDTLPRVPARTLDRAMIVLRGFRLRFPDGNAREVRNIEVKIQPETRGFLLRNGRAPFTVKSALTAESEEADISGGEGTVQLTPGHDVQVHYSVVAWDSKQIHAYGLRHPGESIVGFLGDTGHGRVHYEDSYYDGFFPGDVGVLQGFRISNREGDVFTLDSFGATVGSTSGTYLGGEIRRAGDDVEWDYTIVLDDDASVGTAGAITGTVLTGYSVHAGEIPVNMARHASRGPRSRTTTGVGTFNLVTAAQVSSTNSAGVISTEPAEPADTVFAHIEQFRIITGDTAVTDFEVETIADSSDGLSVLWEMGGGGIAGSEDSFAYCKPLFGALRRVGRGVERVAMREMLIRTWAGEPRESGRGFFRNAGLHPITLVLQKGPGLTRDGGEDRFRFFLWYRNELFDFESTDRPRFFRLEQREVLGVAALYTPPTVVAEEDAPLEHSAMLTARFGLGRRASLQVRGVARAAVAGHFSPATLAFPIEGTKGRPRFASLLPTRGRAIHIGSLYLEDPGVGFRFHANVLGSHAVVAVEFEPPEIEAEEPEAVSTRLIAETNAGPIALELRALRLEVEPELDAVGWWPGRSR